MTRRRDVIASLSAAGCRTGVVSDFDGVLSPIVSDPGRSQLLPGARAALQQVAARSDLLGILSGRPLAFLRERVPVKGAVLLGSYGVERQVDGEVSVVQGAESWRSAIETARGELVNALAAVPGVIIEGKGLAVAVHWRNAADHSWAQSQVQAALGPLAARTGLHVEPGKLVEELRAPLQMDKSVALRSLITEFELDYVAYLGDDRGDLPAFAASRAGQR